MRRMLSRLTHFALHVADAEATAAFYEEFAGMRIIRQWADQSSSGLKVKWLKCSAGSDPFVLVLLEGKSQLFGGDTQDPIGPLSHFGFDLDSRRSGRCRCP
jgi:catechol 2,3-dioxygenase-like lactoylglutathione lyase family enzyme